LKFFPGAIPAVSNIPKAVRIKPPKRQVGLLIEASRAYGRGLLGGISRYVREHRNWSVQYEEWTWGNPPPLWLKNWRGDGIIVRMESQAMASALERLDVPKVDLRGSIPRLGLPLIDTDDRRVAILAAEHLIERGFRHFAFCGFVGANYSDKRSRWFAEYVHRRGFPCDSFTPSIPHSSKATLQLERPNQQFDRELVAWLARLPKPVGIMACNDIRGQQVLGVCRRSGIIAPDEAAVIGVDNDEVLCELADPPLSSVEPNVRRIGYEAAALLESLMQGQAPPRSPLYIEPTGIVIRQSTDVLAIPDRSITAVLRHIREHACDGVRVADLIPVAALSRSVFEHRFKQLVGHSPKAEILRVQLGRARQLLEESDLTLAGIADKCGFKYPEYFATLFRQKHDMTPGDYREKSRRI
jgi:LacI family transcriptional regulator